MKKCPFCAEEIQDEAIVCRYCGRELAPQKVAQVSETLTSFEEASEEPRLESAVQEKLTEQVLADPASESNIQSPIWKSALRVGFISAFIYDSYLLIQFVQGRVSPNHTVLDFIFGSLIYFAIGTLLSLVIIPLWRRKLFYFLFCVIAGVIGLVLVLLN